LVEVGALEILEPGEDLGGAFGDEIFSVAAVTFEDLGTKAPLFTLEVKVSPLNLNLRLRHARTFSCSPRLASGLGAVAAVASFERPDGTQEIYFSKIRPKRLFKVKF
jgi:hypothetical protein